MNSGLFRGGTRCDGPPLWPDHENFLQATLYEKVRFCHFSANFRKKLANLRFPLNIQKQKVFQLQGGFVHFGSGYRVVGTMKI